MTFRAEVPGELTYRDAVGEMLRAACRHVARARSEGTALEWRVLTAFNEAFNNLAKYGAAAGHELAVEVALRVDAARVVLEITDHGPGFDFAARDTGVPPPPDAMDRGGMGLFIIRRAMSRVSYERGPVNRLTMILDLPCAAPADGIGPDATCEETKC
jgi:anti-sigma regulatory factor (Ser/Thr protein kinase)